MSHSLHIHVWKHTYLHACQLFTRMSQLLLMTQGDIITNVTFYGTDKHSLSASEKINNSVSPPNTWNILLPVTALLHRHTLLCADHSLVSVIVEVHKSLACAEKVAPLLGLSSYMALGRWHQVSTVQIVLVSVGHRSERDAWWQSGAMRRIERDSLCSTSNIGRLVDF